MAGRYHGVWILRLNDNQLPMWLLTKTTTLSFLRLYRHEVKLCYVKESHVCQLDFWNYR